MSDKKEQIIETTAALIHFKGYESTKLSDIMEASEIGKGQFYHYFSSKRDLGLHVVDYYVNIGREQLISGVFDLPDTSEQKMVNMLQWAVRYHNYPSKNSGCPFGNLALEMSEHDEEFRKRIHALFEEWIGRLELVIKDLQGEHQALQKARAVVAQIQGGILLMKNYQDDRILGDIIDRIHSQYITEAI
ncbi:TetR/AcrR family transcriptional regulator [Salimicrobium sp. PL1-032A]|uniref:TetR/AcrR family transcriptional regulator n=1 Tax=Salimicrobium sp. PL1-032A TaxID=3095364 RepID=UPI003261883C